MTDKKGLPLDEEQFIKYYESLSQDERDKEIAKLAFRTYIKFDEVVSKEDCKKRQECSYELFKENMTIWIKEKETGFNSKVKLLKGVAWLLTAITVIYNSDGTFKEYYYLKQPAYHTFISTKIVADSPEELFWAGIGDALSKECEVKFACRDKDMYHTPLMGECIASICTDPLVKYGKKALEDCKNNNPSFELEQVALDIIMSTGIVSNFATTAG